MRVFVIRSVSILEDVGEHLVEITEPSAITLEGYETIYDTKSHTTIVYLLWVRASRTIRKNFKGVVHCNGGQALF
jgi:hypothetical protein